MSQLIQLTMLLITFVFFTVIFNLNFITCNTKANDNNQNDGGYKNPKKLPLKTNHKIIDSNKTTNILSIKKNQQKQNYYNRLSEIAKAVYSKNNPFVQKSGPPFIVIEPKQRNSRESGTPAISEIENIISSYLIGIFCTNNI